MLLVDYVNNVVKVSTPRNIMKRSLTVLFHKISNNSLTKRTEKIEYLMTQQKVLEKTHFSHKMQNVML